jgi:hypothetical protein
MRVKAEIRRNAEILGNGLGLSYVLSDIPYGIRFDVTANTGESVTPDESASPSVGITYAGDTEVHPPN